MKFSVLSVQFLTTEPFLQELIVGGPGFGLKFIVLLTGKIVIILHLPHPGLPIQIPLLLTSQTPFFIMKMPSLEIHLFFQSRLVVFGASSLDNPQGKLTDIRVFLLLISKVLFSLSSDSGSKAKQRNTRSSTSLKTSTKRSLGNTSKLGKKNRGRLHKAPATKETSNEGHPDKKTFPFFFLRNTQKRVWRVFFFFFLLFVIGAFLHFFKVAAFFLFRDSNSRPFFSFRVLKKKKK